MIIRDSFTDNAGLCRIPGLRECGPYLSVAAKIGMAFGVLLAFLFLVVFAGCWRTAGRTFFVLKK
jgi:hypothetical protein